MRYEIIISLFVLLLVTNVSIVLASGDHEGVFEQAEEIIVQKISCDDLNEEQLEILGDYYMEQMHPGEAHEIMDERMGGEGSESLRQAHINMGKAFYCGDHGAMSGGMMDMMMGRSGMMGSSGMMGNSYYGSGLSGRGFYGWTFMILVLVALILFIIWLVKQLQESGKRRR